MSCWSDLCVAMSPVTYMQGCYDEFVEQSNEVQMNVSGCQIYEILISPILKDPPPDLLLSGTVVGRVQKFKLLGVHVQTTSDGGNMLAFFASNVG